MTKTKTIPNPPIIRFDQVTVTAHEKTILSDISFTLFPGEKAVLYGKSGSGKSSVLRTLLGLHHLKLGTVYFQEIPLTPASVQTVRSCTAYIGQEPMLGAASVREALLLPFQFKTHAIIDPRKLNLLRYCNDCNQDALSTCFMCPIYFSCFLCFSWTMIFYRYARNIS
ncbi:ATP-binding cassette domain-containing protein [Methylobacter svalbardensis]|uniref:ATP-binding cassette domain-containing protein n=1 Tax=Methylobacter svalbardensis TaxID=3080016 RepID=UPI0030ED6432